VVSRSPCMTRIVLTSYRDSLDVDKWMARRLSDAGKELVA
jgi:hypothetical protein